jgi:hypothetical protein
MMIEEFWKIKRPVTIIDKMNTSYKNNYGYGAAMDMNGNKKVVHHSGGCKGFLEEINRYIDEDYEITKHDNRLLSLWGIRKS